MAAARSPAVVAVKETIVVPVAPVYVPIRLGVQLSKYATNLTKMAADGELESREVVASRGQWAGTLGW